MNEAGDPSNRPDSELGGQGKGGSTIGEHEGFSIEEAWKEYEHVAMHFNDLLLRLRTQALAAVAAFTTIAGVLLTSASIGTQVRWEAVLAVFLALTFFWIAIWVLDLRYYNRLLLGAVEALLDIEEASSGKRRIEGLSLSTLIEQAVARGGPFQIAKSDDKQTVRRNVPKSPRAIATFYLLVLFVLLAGAGWAAWMFRSVEHQVTSVTCDRGTHASRPGPNAASK